VVLFESRVSIGVALVEHSGRCTACYLSTHAAAVSEEDAHSPDAVMVASNPPSLFLD
jgi:hypothetical protein